MRPVKVLIAGIIRPGMGCCLVVKTSGQNAEKSVTFIKHKLRDRNAIVNPFIDIGLNAIVSVAIGLS